MKSLIKEWGFSAKDFKEIATKSSLKEKTNKREELINIHGIYIEQTLNTITKNIAEFAQDGKFLYVLTTSMFYADCLEFVIVPELKQLGFAVKIFKEDAQCHIYIEWS